LVVEMLQFEFLMGWRKGSLITRTVWYYKMLLDIVIDIPETKPFPNCERYCAIFYGDIAIRGFDGLEEGVV
jgi:hypothetical protein